MSGIESTPNPSSFKFDLDETMQHGTGRGGVTYTASSASLAPDPVQKVLRLEGVESVYAMGDWLCLNKVPSAKWDAIVSYCVAYTGGVTTANSKTYRQRQQYIQFPGDF